MASNFFKVDKGVTLAPQSSIASPQNGDVYYDSTRNTYVFRNNGASVDLQSRSDVGTASSLTSSNFTSSVMQSSLVKLTGSTVSNIHGLTASSDAKIVVLYNGSSAVVTIKNASGTEATAGNRILTSTGADVNLNAGEAVQLTYDSTQARWIVVSTPGGSANGGTGKNYLTTYKNNPGNGNFESASTTGWSLGTTGTLTNGLPTGSPTFGSGASGNLSISTVSSGQLAGLYSLSYASSAATTQGNMLASDAFSIDLEDQAKVLTWRFYYKAQTNPGNANWSGTSSNSFGVAIWDVTNSAWLPTTASFGMTQNSGVGYCTGTFQTSANSTQYRLVVYNANATSGAVTVYFDDFFLGPQTAPLGAVITDWIQYTPTFTNFGTASSVSVFSRRNGDSLEVRGKFTTGTVVGGEARMSLGFSGANGNVTIDSNKLPVLTVVGKAGLSATANTTDFTGRSVVANGGNTYVGFGAENNGGNSGFASNGNTVSGNTTPLSFFFAVPIQGWSSNVQMSSDTDTRVVAARFSTNTARATNNTSPTIVYDITEYDSHGSYNNATGSYTVPVTGFYDVFGYFASTAHVDAVGFAFNLHVYRNGVFHSTVAGARVYTTASAIVEGGGSSQIFVNAGDVLTFRIYSDTATTLAINRSGANFVALTRRSGPSVIAAIESVNARYTSTAGQSITNATTPQVNFDTKDYDSHNAVTTGASWKFTAPVSGKYGVKALIIYASANFTVGQPVELFLYKNGSLFSRLDFHPTDATLTNARRPVRGSDDINLLAGDFIDVRTSHSESAARSLSTISGDVHISIARIGN